MTYDAACGELVPGDPPGRDRSGGDAGFAVYVHWPFCQSKCPYCDFNSHVRHGGVDEAAYVAAYVSELRHMASLTRERAVRSVFFGGGTPSLLKAESVAAIIEEIARLWDLEADIEISLEANPSSVEAGRFAGYRDAGVNRVSLGVQALSDSDLSRLGRLHSANEARKAVEIAACNFGRVSIDLIYARPDQQVVAWKAELAEAIALGTSHLALYQLTIEAGTAFANLHAAGKLQVPDDDVGHALYCETQNICQKAGFSAYEVSNHARPGEACRHNLVYWRAGRYVGVGPGAHGRIDVAGKRIATSTLSRPEDWLEQVHRTGCGLAERGPLSRCERAEEMVLMGLRLSEGLHLGRLKRDCGYAIDAGGLAHLVDLRLLDFASGEAGEHLRATAQGRLVLNALTCEVVRSLLPEGRDGEVRSQGSLTTWTP